MGLLYGLKDAHVGLDDVHNVVDVLAVLTNELFFLLEDHLDQVLMVPADLVNIVCVLDLDLLVGLQGHLTQRLGHLRVGPLGLHLRHRLLLLLELRAHGLLEHLRGGRC